MRLLIFVWLRFEIWKRLWNLYLNVLIYSNLIESQFEEELAGIFGRILEYEHSSTEEPSNGNDLATSVLDVIGYSPMSLSGPDHGISYDEPQDDFANFDEQEDNEGISNQFLPS